MRRLLFVLASVIAVFTFSCDTTDPSFDDSVPDLFDLSITISPEGAGTVEPSEGEFVNGATIELEAIPELGFVFERWEGDLSGSQNPTILRMNEDRSVTAVFAEADIPLNVDVAGEGNVNVEILSQVFKQQQSSEMKAGEESEEPGNTDTSDSETIQSDRENLDIDGRDRGQRPGLSDNNGKTPQSSPQAGMATSSAGYASAGIDTATVKLTAEPNAGWLFERWEGDLTGSENPDTLVVNREMNVTAFFKQVGTDIYTLTREVQGQGSIEADPESELYDENEPVTLTAVPAEDWRFTEWQGDLGGSENPETIIMDGDKSVTAIFAEIGAPIVNLVQQPSQTTAGSAINPAPTIQILNDLEEPLEGINVSAGLNKNEFTSSSATSVATNENGIARFDNLVVEAASEGYTIIFDADDPDVPSTSSSEFNVTPASPDPANSEASVPDGVAGEETNISITVRDSFENPVDGAAGQLSVAVSGANSETLSPSESSDAGVYTASYTPSNAGTDNIEITLGGTPIEGSPFSSEVITSDISSTVSTVTADPTELQVGNSSTVTIELRDDVGNGIGGLLNSEFDIDVSGNGTAGSVSETTTAGNYQFDVSNNTAEQVTVTVNASGVTLSDKPQINYTPAEPELLAIPTGSQPGTSVAGDVISNSPTIRITDEFGNNIPGLDVTVSEQSGQEFASGTETVTTNSSGRAVFDDLVINNAGRYNLVFTAGSLTATSNAFDVNPAEANPSETTAQVPNGAAGDRTDITITVHDSYDNRVEGVAGDLSVSISGANSDKSADAITDEGNGVYRTGYTPTSNGTDEITIRLDGSEIQGSPFSSDVITSDAAIVLIQQQPEQTVAGATIQGPPSVLVTDALDNPVKDIEVVASLQGSASFDGGSTTVSTTTNGIAVFDDLVVETAGSYNIAFNAIGVSEDAISSSFDVVAAAADNVNIKSGNNQSATVTQELGNPFEVRVTDRFGNPVPNIAVNFSIDDTPSGASGQSLSSTSDQTNGSGEASTRLTLGDKPGGYSVNASVSGVGAVTFGATATAGAAESFEFETISSPQTAGQPFTISITALDSEGNTASGYQGSASLSAASGSISPNSISFTNGTASADVEMNTASGNQSVTATDGSISGTSNSFVVESGGVDSGNSSVSANPTSQQVGNSSTLTIVLLDASGNEITGLSNSDFNVFVEGDGSAGTVSETATDGTYTTSISNTTAQAVTVTVTADGVVLDDEPTINFTPGAASDVSKISGDNQSGTVTNQLSSDFVVRVTDQFGNVISGETVGFTIAGTPAGSGGASLSSTSESTNNLGEASTRLTLGDTPGTYTVDASVSGAGSVTFSAQADAGDASDMAITVQPSNTTAGADISPAPEVEVTDDVGNPVEGVSVVVGLQGGSFSSGTTSQTTNSSGIASFTGLEITAAGSYTLEFDAGASGVSNVTSNSFNVTAADADNITIESGNNQAADVSQQLGADFVVEVTDAFGNPVQGETVSFSITGTPGGSNGSLSSTSDNTDGNGFASTRYTLGDTPGEYTIAAVVSGAGLVEFTATASAGAAESFSFGNISSPQTAGQPFTISITALDSEGNTATGYGGTATLSAAKGTISPTGISFTNGTASGDVELDTATDDESITATDGSISGTSNNFNVETGSVSAVNSSVSADPTNLEAGSNSTVTIEVRDGLGNPISGLVDSDFAITVTGSGSAGTVTESGSTGNYTTSINNSTAETVTVTVSAAGVEVGEVDIEFTAGAAASFEFGSIGTQTAGNLFTITITAFDDQGNQATGYNSTANLSTTAGTITPATADFGSGEVSLDVEVSEAGADQTITAEDGSVNGTSNAFDVESGSVDGGNSSVSADPTTLEVGNSSTVTIELRDDNNNPVSGLASDITVDVGGSGTAGTVTEDGSTGNYTTDVSNTTAETVTVSVSVNGVNVGSVDIEFTPGSASSGTSSIEAAPETGLTADGSDSSTLTITARDGSGNEVEGEDVFFLITGGNGSLSSGPWTTDTNGQATATLTSTDANTVTVTSYLGTDATGSEIGTVSVEFVPGDADAGQSEITADDASIPADGSSTTTIRITLKDANGNELTTGGDNISLSTNTGTLLNSITDNGDGTYSQNLQSSTTVETATVEGTVDGSSIGTVSVDFVTGSASKMSVDTQPLQSTAGEAISGPPSVLVTDSGSNPVSGVAVTASLNGATLTTGSEVQVSTNTSGIAEFTNLITETAGTGYTLTFDADAAGVDNADSDLFDVVAGSPASVVALADNGTALADGSDQLQFTVTVEDANSNPVSGVFVDATNNGTDISYPSGTSLQTDGSGQATFTATSTTAQSNVDFTFTEQDNLNQDTAQGSFENNSDFSLTDPGTITSGETFELEITGAQDIAGNALDGLVNVTVTSSEDADGEVHNAEETFTSGTANVPVTLSTEAEHTLTVNVGGVTDDKSIQVTVTS